MASTSEVEASFAHEYNYPRGAFDGRQRSAADALAELTIANRSECRSCGATITWAVTDKGKKIPIDAQRAALHGGGQFDLVPEGRILRARYIDKFEQRRRGDRGMQPGYPSHFTTCPSADEHRRS